MSASLKSLNTREREIRSRISRTCCARCERLKPNRATSNDFPYFINKSAPISGVQSLLITKSPSFGAIENDQYTHTSRVLVP